MLATAAERPASFGVAEAGRLAAAIGLPESPAAAVALLLILLAVTYALLTVFIKVGVPGADTASDGEDEGADTGDGPPDPDWPSETVPDYPEPYGADRATIDVAEDPEYVREPLAIETLRVRDRHIALGDSASLVMGAFRPGEGETVPMVQRDASGKASYVSRTYRVGRHLVTLVLERDSPADPLTLVRIEVAP